MNSTGNDREEYEAEQKQDDEKAKDVEGEVEGARGGDGKADGDKAGGDEAQGEEEHKEAEETQETQDTGSEVEGGGGDEDERSRLNVVRGKEGQDSDAKKLMQKEDKTTSRPSPLYMLNMARSAGIVWMLVLGTSLFFMVKMRFRMFTSRLIRHI